MTVYFTAEATTKGGREGHVKSNDHIIDLDLAMPKPNQVSTATNPEQLFAAGYSACYDGALNLVAQRKRLKIESTVTGKVSLLKDESDNGYKIGVVLEVEISGVSQEQAEELTHEAHQVCPYSKATRGNIDVKIITKSL
ncbi:Organic hydroperoxide resistance protein OhrA [Bacillus mobilis]|uniref:Organic hydroperoxide resistance protein OhrA n=1 Tax=Bacillus mobilis TaxID=2026190 RepID=A0A1Y6A2V2_9BACI|nr:organic hydroperoxide resistance protein [Bacillus mobilis]SME19110.1 Organic hydroperoxide resistance protein OhrA [Bacillus mobilis]